MAPKSKSPRWANRSPKATVGEWLKKPGEAVAADEPIASLETDKVAVEVPSPVAGVMGEQLARRRHGRGRRGDRADRAMRQRLRPHRSACAGRCRRDDQPSRAPARRPRCTAMPARPSPSAERDDDHVTTSRPSVRRAVLEHRVDPTQIQGTGKDGRLTKEDVIAAAQAQKSRARAAPRQQGARSAGAAGYQLRSHASRCGRTSRGARQMTRLRQTIAKRLKEAQNTAAMLTTFNDVDMTAVMDARGRYKELFEKKHGIRLGFMGFFVKACALAVKDVPASTPASKATRSSITIMSTSRSRSRRPRAWSCR